MLENMHDWTFENVHLEWSTATATLCLQSPREPRKVLAHGFSYLKLSRSLPWGSSLSINSHQETQGDGDKRLLKIEMQSGDMIQIEASSFALNFVG